MCGRRPQVGQDHPCTRMPRTRSLRQRKMTQATAKLQIYWSGNKYKYLIKKLLWRDLYTTVFSLDSATPARTSDPDPSAQGQGKPPTWQVAGELNPSLPLKPLARLDYFLLPTLGSRKPRGPSSWFTIPMHSDRTSCQIHG